MENNKSFDLKLRLTLVKMSEIDHGVCQAFQRIMPFSDSLKPEQQTLDFILFLSFPALAISHLLN
ncbi:hypothetical protein AM1_B0118 (plasmid) [Acaryochloris marina MBIC11017]|uniref:Uncharacterized protein n=1 Tax=Acaryochloris marina (strain MBIC 11017) TaxID=329726 RepID=A8ZM74_ACAM1|nr:hypothetical protein AM1_B0118 [Acaryochloris marina MBIC11017]